MLAYVPQGPETQCAKAIVGGLELLLEFSALNPFGMRQVAEPSFHVGMALVHSEATLDNLWNAESCREKCIQVSLERPLPPGVENRACHLKCDVRRCAFGGFKRTPHLLQMELCMLELQVHTRPEVLMHECPTYLINAA